MTTNGVKLFGSLIALVAIVSSAFTQQLEKNESEYEGYAAAKARLTAVFEVKEVPIWRNRAGQVPHWQEIGPRVLKHSWGDMDNAGRTCALVVDPRDPKNLYVGAASGGIWKSTDEGRSWDPVGDHAASLSIGALAIDPFNPDVIYAGTGEMHYSIDSFHGAGILRSLDAGRTWELLASDVFLGFHVSRIVPNPNRPGFLYASTSRGVFRSLDGGANWVQLLNGAACDLLVDPRNANTVMAAIGLPWGAKANGIYKSFDAGMTWTRQIRDLPTDGTTLGRTQIDQCAAFPNVVYASIYGSSGGLRGLYRSTDFGETWVRKPNAPSYGGGQAWYDNCLAVSRTNPNVVFVGGFSTFRSTDGGDTWADNTRSYDGGQVHPDHHSFTFSPTDPSTLYLCTDGGVFRTRNIGETWESVSNGLGTIQFQSVDVHPWDENIAYGGAQDNGTNNYTGSTAWTNHFLGDGGTTRVNPTNPSVVYTEYVGLVICKSTDSGLNWDWNTTNGIDPAEGKLFYAPFNIDPNNSDTLVAGAQKVYRTTDAAANWQAISPVLGSRVSAVSVAPGRPEVIYAGTSDGRTWVTATAGRGWSEISKGLPRSYVNDICIDPRDSRVAYVSLAGWEPNRIWKTTDRGETWTNVSGGLPGMPIQAIAVHPRHPDMVFIATYAGVFVSEGKGWRRMGNGLPNCPVFSLVANTRTGWLTVGTHGRGAWRIALPE